MSQHRNTGLTTFQTPREDRLVLFTVAACVYRNAGSHATH